MRRNNIFIWIATLLSIFVVSCSDSDMTSSQEAENGMMHVNLQITLPQFVNATRAAGNAQNDIQMLCFDKNGLFIGTGKEMKVTSKDDTHGNLTGEVPGNTSRIHFLANGSELIPQNTDSWIGLNENFLIGNLTTKANEGTPQMVYWGYEKRSNAEEMKSFLSDGTIYLVRNCARITIGVVNPDYEVTGMVVCNVLEYGTIAPFKYGNENPFHYYEGEKVDISQATMPVNQTKMSNPSDVTLGQKEVLIYENENKITDPVRVVLKIKHDNKEEYFLVYLMDDKKNQYTVIRNHEYRINIRNIEGMSGYSSFAEALKGRPVNNEYVQVDDLVSSINGMGEILTRKEKNYQIFSNPEGTPNTVKIEFTLTDLNGKPKEGNFEIKWISNEGISNDKVPTIQYNPSTGEGSLSLNLKYSDDLTKGVMELKETNENIAILLHVYTITSLNFNASLTKLPTMAEKGKELYQLEFTIPDKFPSQLLPLECKFAVGNLESYTQNQQEHIDISSESTEELPDEEAKKWGYWYSLKATSGSHTIKLIRTRPGNGKLYLKASHFNTFVGEY